MKHWYDVDIAAERGRDQATLIEAIGYWTRHNEANDANIKDGRAWTRMSRKAWKELYPEISIKRIDAALDALEADGVILVDTFNENKRDRTKWFTLTDNGKAIFNGTNAAETVNVNFPNGEIASYQNEKLQVTESGNLQVTETGNCSINTSIVNNTKIINLPYYKPIIKDIVEYLNEKAGLHFKAESRETERLILARMKEGYSVDDFKRVIDNKVAEWKDDHEMARFIRPMTLFGTKFESYLNQKTPPKKSKLGGQAYHGDSFDTEDFFEAAVKKGYEYMERRSK